MMVFFIMALHEKYILFYLRDVADSLGKKGVVFFDIGANVGQHTLFMSRLVKEVHAFDSLTRPFLIDLE